MHDSQVMGQTSQGVEIQATLLHLTRYSAVFEIYNPTLALCNSEVLGGIKIMLCDRTVYSGRAVICNLVSTSATLICEATLQDSWQMAEGLRLPEANPSLTNFSEFFHQWQKIYKVRPEFKSVVSDMQIFLTDLRMWLEQVELVTPAFSPFNLARDGREMAAELGASTQPVLTKLFEEFEHVLRGVEPEFQPVHQVFCRRQLHPLLLCAPFMNRTFAKPLGYAGDYEMVNMIMRDPLEGGSLYAQVINYWFLQQPPAKAHRNRISYLVERLVQTTRRVAGAGRSARILSLGCGPAAEVQRFMQNPLADQAQFTLLDFNQETLAHTQSVLEKIRRAYQRTTPIGLIKKSVTQVLKEAAKHPQPSAEQQYDLVYCAGLFDYLADPICQQLTHALYDWVAPGGMLITTNVDDSNPRRLTMDYLMEWHLIYRNGRELSAFKPKRVLAEDCRVIADDAGVNLYFEVNKPNGE